MCGITGYYSISELDGKSMLEAINHRGPDHTGYFEKQIYESRLFLGHKRLSIIDLSSCGNQPMHSADGSVTIIFNGEIYNFEQLKANQLSEYKFKSRTDTEVLLYLYKKYGIEFLNMLRGDFAICLFDEHKSKLFLIRDHAGIKPLYYYYSNNSFVFSSEIKSILKSGITAGLDEDQLQKYFVFKYVPHNDTLFKGIKRLAPAHYLEYDLKSKKISIHQYWKLSKNENYSSLKYNDAKNTLNDLLSETVQMQLMSDVQVGTFFSGGVDSSIIAYYLRNQKNIIHYSARKSKKDLSKEGSTSDFYYANKIAKEWNLNLHAIDIGADEANTGLINKTIFYADDLIADGSQIPSFLITREASKTSRVLLSGMGADELFAGYAGHQISLASQFFDYFPDFISTGINKFFASLNQGKGSFLAYRRYLNKLGKYYGNGKLRYGFLNIVGDVENAQSVCKIDSNITDEIFKNYFANDNNVFDNIFKFEYDNFLVKNLHYFDRMCMANSVEGRVPFLDKYLVEFAFSLPRHYKISNMGKTKRILKETYNTKLPSYIIQRRKAGFGMPLRSIFSNESTINKLLDKDFFSSFNYFSLDNLSKCIKTHIAGAEDNSALIYALICYQEWYKMFIKR